MTLDKLARMMMDGFSEVNQRIDRVESAIRDIRSDMENYHLELRDHENRIQSLERKTGVA